MHSEGDLGEKSTGHKLMATPLGAEKITLNACAGRKPCTKVLLATELGSSKAAKETSFHS